MASDELLKEFKARNHITHSGEDGNIKKLLSYSIAYVESRCGPFDTDSDNILDKQATELAIERTRYAYNEALEYFEDNFLSEIFSLGIEMGADNEKE